MSDAGHKPFTIGKVLLVCFAILCCIKAMYGMRARLRIVVSDEHLIVVRETDWLVWRQRTYVGKVLTTSGPPRVLTTRNTVSTSLLDNDDVSLDNSDAIHDEGGW